MRLAYFVTSYRSPRQLVRLVRTLRAADPGAYVLVHHDVGGAELPYAQLRALGAELLTAQTPIVWGDLTLEAVRWRAFGVVLARADVDWVVLLSEQDYPVAPAAALKDFLAVSGADAVLEAEPIDGIADPALRRECGLRYGYRYRALPRLPFGRRPPAAVRRALLFGYMAANKVQRRVRFYFFPAALGLPTRVGLRMAPAERDRFGTVHYSGAWYALSRRAMEHVTTTVREQPDFVARSARTIIPLESATATLVCTAPHLTVARTPLHHIRWSDRTSGRPDEFGLADLAELTASGRFFARKVPVDDDRLLDALDARVLGRPTDDGPSPVTVAAGERQ